LYRNTKNWPEFDEKSESYYFSQTTNVELTYQVAHKNEEDLCLDMNYKISYGEYPQALGQGTPISKEITGTSLYETLKPNGLIWAQDKLCVGSFVSVKTLDSSMEYLQISLTVTELPKVDGKDGYVAMDIQQARP